MRSAVPAPGDPAPAARLVERRRAPYRVTRALYRRLRGLRGGRLVAHPLARAVQARLTRRSMAPAEVLGILDALTAAGIPSWLAGGWGVDALAGRATRRHDDVDLAVAPEHEEAAVAVLERLGFTPVGSCRAPAPWPGRHTTMIDGRGGEIDVHGANLLEVCAEPFAAGRLGGRPAPCLSREAQRALHRGYAMRARDRRDLSLLDGGARAR